MKTNWLFPHKYRLYGWLILGLIGFLLVFGDYLESAYNIQLAPPLEIDISNTWLQKLFDTSSLNFTDEILLIGVIVGLFFVAFAREKSEDEMISQLRLTALQWSIYLYYAALALAIIVVHGLNFYDVMLYCLFSVLIVFIICFRLLLRKQAREADKEVLS